MKKAPDLLPLERQQFAVLDSGLRYARAQIGPDVTVQRLLILINVYLHEGLSQNELLLKLDSTSIPALSRNLADLSKRTSRKTVGPNLVQMKTDPDNLRKKRIFLTAKGRRFLIGMIQRMTAVANKRQ